MIRTDTYTIEELTRAHESGFDFECGNGIIVTCIDNGSTYYTEWREIFARERALTTNRA